MGSALHWRPRRMAQRHMENGLTPLGTRSTVDGREGDYGVAHEGSDNAYQTSPYDPPSCISWNYCQAGWLTMGDLTPSEVSRTPIPVRPEGHHQ